jgi:hypothetical protein
MVAEDRKDLLYILKTMLDIIKAGKDINGTAICAAELAVKNLKEIESWDGEINPQKTAKKATYKAH